MARRTSPASRRTSPARILKWFAKYRWFERYRCCDQEYEIELDDTTDEEIEELKQDLLDSNDDLCLDVPLYMDAIEVGTIRVDLRQVFKHLSKNIRYRRQAPDDHFRPLTDEELETPLTETELRTIVKTIADLVNELHYEDDLITTLCRVAQDIVPAVNAGPEATLKLLKRMSSLEVLRSRRLLLALSSIGWANSFQKQVAESGDSAWRRRVEAEGPQTLVPVDVTTGAIAAQLRRLLERPSHIFSRSWRRVDPESVRKELKAARGFLSQFRRRASYFTIDACAAKPTLVAEFPEVAARLAPHIGLLESWLPCGPFDRTLEEIASELVAAEHDPPISPATVRDYARRKPAALRRRLRTEEMTS